MQVSCHHCLTGWLSLHVRMDRSWRRWALKINWFFWPPLLCRTVSHVIFPSRSLRRMKTSLLKLRAVNKTNSMDPKLHHLVVPAAKPVLTITSPASSFFFSKYQDQQRTHTHTSLPPPLSQVICARNLSPCTPKVSWIADVLFCCLSADVGVIGVSHGPEIRLMQTGEFFRLSEDLTCFFFLIRWSVADTHNTDHVGLPFNPDA